MSEPKDDGGPDAPMLVYYPRAPGGTATYMSLRDYFAGQALAGIFANEAGLSRMRESATFSGEMIALAAYAQADAMLRMRTKP